MYWKKWTNCAHRTMSYSRKKSTTGEGVEGGRGGGGGGGVGGGAVEENSGLNYLYIYDMMRAT